MARIIRKVSNTALGAKNSGECASDFRSHVINVTEAEQSASSVEINPKLQQCDCSKKGEVLYCSLMRVGFRKFIIGETLVS